MNGWNAFDRMVMWAVEHSHTGTFGDVVRLLPDRIDFRLIAESLRWLASQGLITRTTTVVDGALTPTYTSAVALESATAA